MSRLPTGLLNIRTSLRFRGGYVWLLLLIVISQVIAQDAATAAKEPAATAPATEGQISPGDKLRVIKAGAKVHKRDKSVMHVSKGTRVEVSKVRGEWIGGYVTVGDNQIPGWVLLADLGPAPDVQLVEAGIATLEKLGVTIERDPAGLPHTANAEEVEISDEHLVYFRPLVDLQEVNLSGTKITGTGLENLARLTGLERLYLDNTAVTNESLQAIAELKGLTGLSLAETRLTDAGMKHLAGLKNLKVLNLADTEITDKGLEHIADLNGIETLSLSRTKITGTGFKGMQDFQDLITLNLDGCELAPGTLQSFIDLKKIRIMRMYDAVVPENDILELKDGVGGLAIFR